MGGGSGSRVYLVWEYCGTFMTYMGVGFGIQFESILAMEL